MSMPSASQSASLCEEPLSPTGSVVVLNLTQATPQPPPYADPAARVARPYHDLRFGSGGGGGGINLALRRSGGA
jgi:hypothetical protein